MLRAATPAARRTRSRVRPSRAPRPTTSSWPAVIVAGGRHAQHLAGLAAEAHRGEQRLELAPVRRGDVLRPRGRLQVALGGAGHADHHQVGAGLRRTALAERVRRHEGHARGCCPPPSATRGCGNFPRMPLIQSPLHDRHVAAGRQARRVRRLGDAAGVPDRRAQGARRGPRRRSASSTSATSARSSCAATVRWTTSTLPEQRPRPDRPRPGAVHPRLRRGDRRHRRRPDRLLPRRRPRAARPQRRQLGRGPAPARGGRAGRRHDHRPPPRRTRCSRSRARSSDEVLAAVGLPVGHDYMSFEVAPFEGADVVVCRTGYTGERGYELIAENAAAPALWDALLAAGEPHGSCPAAWAPATPCAPRWATRCTARTSAST